MRGSIESRTSRRGVSHFVRPVYWSARASQATGTMTIPRYSMLSQKSLAGMSPPANSKAYPSDHSATASIRIVNGAIPAVKRRLQAKSASPADITAAMTTGNRYGVNRQYIVLLLSCLIVQPFGRAPWYSALLVGPGPVTQFVCSAKQLLKNQRQLPQLIGTPGHFVQASRLKGIGLDGRRCRGNQPNLLQIVDFLVAQPLSLQASSEPGTQQHGVERLGQVILGPQFNTFDDALQLVYGGNHNHRDVAQAGVGLELFEHLVAVHFGHLHVQQHQVIGFGLEFFQRLSSVFGQAGPIAEFGNVAGEHDAIHAVVVHDQEGVGGGG